jgi:hypothetical protein
MLPVKMALLALRVPDSMSTNTLSEEYFTVTAAPLT